MSIWFKYQFLYITVTGLQMMIIIIIMLLVVITAKYGDIRRGISTVLAIAIIDNFLVYVVIWNNNRNSNRLSSVVVVHGPAAGCWWY